MSVRLQPILVVPDTHAPHHDRRAWALMIKVAKALKPHYLICIGDLADFYTVSAHSKDPRRAALLVDELVDVHKCLDDLDSLKAKDKRFIAGNHCDRYTRYLQNKAPELFGVTSIPDLLQLKQRGWSYTPYKKHSKIGKMHFTHDVGSSVAGRYASFRNLDTYQHSVIAGHTHRLQYIVEGNAIGEQKLSAMFGWLGDVNKVDYMQEAAVKKNWSLGFGIGYHNPKTGIVYMTPIPIVKYTCVVNGVLYAT